MPNASERKITRQWTGVMDDMIHEKEVKNLKKTVMELIDIIASLTNRNTELEGQKKGFLHKYYEAAIPAGNSRPPARWKSHRKRNIRIHAHRKKMIPLFRSPKFLTPAILAFNDLKHFFGCFPAAIL